MTEVDLSRKGVTGSLENDMTGSQGGYHSTKRSLDLWFGPYHGDENRGKPERGPGQSLDRESRNGPQENPKKGDQKSRT